MEGRLLREEHSKQWEEGTEANGTLKGPAWVRRYPWGTVGIQAQNYSSAKWRQALKKQECNSTGTTE